MRTALGALRRRVPAPGALRARASLEVYYDAWCPVCAGFRRRAERLDWLGLIRFRSLRDADAARDAGVTPERSLRRMHARTGEGRTLEGIAAMAALSARLPVTLPLWPLLAAARAAGVGEWIYDRFAARRTGVPQGACEAGARALDGTPLARAEAR